MPFITSKTINGQKYFYLRTSKRVEGKVKAITLAYLGKDLKKAQEKSKEIINLKSKPLKPSPPKNAPAPQAPKRK